jgi:L-lactate utilization protein LutB
MYARRLANKEGIKRKHLRQLAQAVVKPLGQNGFTPIYVENREQARKELLALVPEGATVGVGGSMTIREIGVLEELTKRGHLVHNHWQPGLSQEEIMAIRRAHLSCDVFLTSTNAITLRGQIVSTDGVGNRVCAMTFGPKRVIIAAGANKIVRDLDAALARVKEICAPRTMGESDEPVPCVRTGVCTDCESPARACRATIILDRRPMLTETFVLLIGEELGF